MQTTANEQACIHFYTRLLHTRLESFGAEMAANGVPIIESPVIRTGATSKIRSIYVRDPDLNLIEISEIVG